MPHLTKRPSLALAAGLMVAVTGLAACGGGSSSAASKGADSDAAAACAALVRSTPVGTVPLALSHRLQGAAQLALAAVGENGSTYSNLDAVALKLLNDVNSDSVSQLSGDVSNMLAICKGDSLPH